MTRVELSVSLFQLVETDSLVIKSINRSFYQYIKTDSNLKLP